MSDQRGACPTCGAPGFYADEEQGIGYCTRRSCVENERRCPGGCDGTGRIVEHHRDCAHNLCVRACPVVRTCDTCFGAGFVLADEVGIDVSW